MSEQLALFEAAELEQRAGWRRLFPASYGKCCQRWEHVPSGAWVIHCGHPTAHRPWYAVDADGLPIHDAHDYGEGPVHWAVWQKLADAKLAVEAWVSGRTKRLPPELVRTGKGRRRVSDSDASARHDRETENHGG